MTEPLTPADEVVLRRRRFLRGGALLAAAAGGAVAAGATTALPAAAATGDPVKAGQATQATAATVLQADLTGTPALQLQNADGAALELTRSGDPVELAVNQLAGTSLGPTVGVKYPDDDNVYTDYLATSSDVSSVPVSYALPPERIVDGVTVKKGKTIDVVVDTVDEGFVPIAAYLVVTSSSSKKDGSLSVYVPGDSRGKSVTVSFLKGKTMSGSTYAALGTTSTGKQAFRVYASQDTKVSVDLTGVTELDEEIFAAGAGSARRADRAAAKPARVAAARLVR